MIQTKQIWEDLSDKWLATFPGRPATLKILSDNPDMTTQVW